MILHLIDFESLLALLVGIFFMSFQYDLPAYILPKKKWMRCEISVERR